MLLSNNAAIGLVTRRNLRAMLADGSLDEESLTLIECALAKTRPRSHAGWVFLLAEALGAERPFALACGSLAEVFCCAVDLVDDVEDGDAGAYLPDTPQALQINLAAHLWIVVALFSAQLDARSNPAPLSPHLLRLTSSMACGQRIEILRHDWSTAAYVEMTRLTGGCQFEAYLRMSAFAARVDPGPLLPLAMPMALLLQLTCDTNARDPRLRVLDESEVRSLGSTAAGALAQAMCGVPTQALPVLQPLVGVLGADVWLR